MLPNVRHDGLGRQRRPFASEGREEILPRDVQQSIKADTPIMTTPANTPPDSEMADRATTPTTADLDVQEHHLPQISRLTARITTHEHVQKKLEDTIHSDQHSQPPRVIERVGRSAYRLDTPRYWNIHNIVSIDYVEPAPADIF